MNRLPSDLQRILPYVVVAVLAIVGLVLVTRTGVGGGGDAPADAQRIVRTAFEKSPQSGVADIRVAVTAELVAPGGEQQPQTTRARVVGSFVEPTSKDPFALGEADVRFSETEERGTSTVRAVAAGERGYVQVDGRWYELDEQQARRVFNDDETGRHQGVLEDGEFNLERWTRSPELDGTASVDGVQTHRIAGTFDMDAMFTDLEIADSEPERALWRNATKQGQVELFVGKDDGILRKAVFSGQAAAQGPGGQARLSVRFDLALREVNRPQQIAAPKDAAPVGAVDKLSRATLGPVADEVLAKRTKSGRGSRAGGGSKSGERGASATRSPRAYIGCVQEAADTAALERCQRFLPRR